MGNDSLKPNPSTKTVPIETVVIPYQKNESNTDAMVSLKKKTMVKSSSNQEKILLSSK